MLPTYHTIIPIVSYWQEAIQANEKNQEKKNTLRKNILHYFILNLPDQVLTEYKRIAFEPTVMTGKGRLFSLLGFKSK